MQELELQRVFKGRVAGQLVAEGFKLYDTHPNKHNPKLDVFRFIKTPKLLRRLEELKSLNTVYKHV